MSDEDQRPSSAHDVELDAAAPSYAPPAHAPIVERFPWASLSLIAVCAVLFAIELIAPVVPATGFADPAPTTLIAMGGSIDHWVFDVGQWYRLFTATLLHGSVLHLAMNCIALYMAGAFLESVLHRTWFLALFILGGLGGSALSLATLDANTVSVGASGAIMALLAAACILAFRVPPGDRAAVQGQLLRMLVPSLLPVVTGVDYGAHIGGAITGAVVGWLLLKKGEPLGETSERPPRGRRLAQVIVAFGAILFVYGFGSVYRGYGVFHDGAALAGLLAPAAEWPGADTTAEQARDLTTRYPRDPRGWFILALHTEEAGDPTAAKPMLERALAEKHALDAISPDHRFETGIRASLVRILLGEDKRSEAEAIAAPACHWGPGNAVPEFLTPYDVCK